jgi:putative redox protein
MQATVEYLGGAKFEVEARGHRILSDQPFENAGANSGMTPPEFLLASLGTCAGYYAAEYLRARSLPAHGLRVKVKAEKALRPARLSAFRIEISLPGLEDERHREGVLRAAQACLIHNTLLHTPAVQIALAPAAEAEIPTH